MELTTIEQPAITRKQGVDEYDLSAGQHLLLKMHNETVLNESVPTGKTWHVIVEIRIEESNI